MISRTLFEGELEAIQIGDHDLEAVVIPGLGGKISSIRWLGRELLARNPDRPFRLARYAAPYADYDASGFDECLPTIGPCRYPEYPWEGAQLPDHGEVWALPWSYKEEDGWLHLRTRGIRIPYIFEKWIRFPQPGRISIRYSLTNPTPFPFRYLWSSHPLVAPQPGMRIYLPKGIRVRVDWSKGGRLGDLLSEHDWPHTLDCQGQPVDLSLITTRETQQVDKLYTTRLPEGWCAVHDAASGLYLAFLFSPEKIPYVGLSINMGGWPEDKDGQTQGYYNLGIEPCSGYPDRLDTAIERGDCPTLAPDTHVEWDLQIRVGRTEEISTILHELAETSNGGLLR